MALGVRALWTAVPTLTLFVSAVQAQTPSGTGFVIAPNTLVTNHHVLEGCDDPRVVTSRGPLPARVLDSDANTDLALIWVSGLGGPAARLRLPASAELGEQAFVFGFTYKGALSSSDNFTNGIGSTLPCLRDTRHHLQITAPVQPGNSGGPLLDEAGNVIGVVVAKLDALRMAVATGDIPQNVNFAVSVDALHRFLAKASVPVTTQRLTARLPTTNIAVLARTFTLPIQCGLSVAGGDSPPSERRREAERQREADRQREQERLRELERERQRELERRMAARQEAAENAQDKAADRPAEPRKDGPPLTTPNPSGHGAATVDAAPSRSYGGLLVAAIRPKIIYTYLSETNYETEVCVTARPDGRITAIRVTKPSGSRVWDDALVRALERTERLPPDLNGQVPAQITREGMVVVLRPRDLASRHEPSVSAEPYRTPCGGVASSLPCLRDLPTHVQSEVPPLLVNGWVRSADPGGRQLVVNGILLREGDTLTPVIRLEQIGTRSATFSVRQHCFEVPISL